MAEQRDDDDPEGAAPWPIGGGEAASLVRRIDWSQSPLGPIASWPASLTATVGMLLHSRHPMFLWWGPELIQFYNDAYVPSFGEGKHPAAMAQRGQDCWREIWPVIFPQIDDVMTRAKASWNEDHLVPVWRNGRIEEVYWTYGYSPVFTEAGAVGGTLVVCTETTARVLAGRRLGALNLLAHATLAAKTVEELLAAATTLFAQTRNDTPFALLYAMDIGVGPVLSLAIGLGERERLAVDAFCRTMLPLAPADGVIAAGQALAGTSLPGGPWAEPCTSLFVHSLGDSDQARRFLIFGLSPRLPFDSDYRDYLGHIAEHLGLALTRMGDIQALKEATAARARALEEAERTSRAKDEFLATMSHELRTPLNAILGWATMLRSDFSDPTRLQRGLAVIERNARTQARIISDLLDVSRIISGKLRLTVAKVELSAVVSAAIDVVKQAADAKALRLNVVLDPRAGGLLADPDRLQQVMWNLMSNAVKFTPRGGSIYVSTQLIASSVRIQVKDTGPGIPGEHLPFIFERFRQVDGTITRSQGGLGLGLAIVRHLVEAHGGTVTASSEGLGTGSTFTVTLPIHAVYTPPPEPDHLGVPTPPPPRMESLGGRAILIVDDDDDSLELLRVLLESEGATVTEANSTRQALRTAARGRFDVIISDIGMPEIDGYAFMRRLRSENTGVDIPAIALTAYASAEDADSALTAGYQAHITKPVDGSVLVAMIERMLPKTE